MIRHFTEEMLTRTKLTVFTGARIYRDMDIPSDPYFQDGFVSFFDDEGNLIQVPLHLIAEVVFKVAPESPSDSE